MELDGVGGWDIVPSRRVFNHPLKMVGPVNTRFGTMRCAKWVFPKGDPLVPNPGGFVGALGRPFWGARGPTRGFGGRSRGSSRVVWGRSLFVGH